MVAIVTGERFAVSEGESGPDTVLPFALAVLAGNAVFGALVGVVGHFASRAFSPAAGLLFGAALLYRFVSAALHDLGGAFLSIEGVRFIAPNFAQIIDLVLPSHGIALIAGVVGALAGAIAWNGLATRFPEPQLKAWHWVALTSVAVASLGWASLAADPLTQRRLAFDATPETYSLAALVRLAVPANAGIAAPSDTLYGAPLLSPERWAATIELDSGKEPPHVILLVLESFRRQEMTSYGATHTPPVTPVLDRLAAEGTQFANAWAASPQSEYAQPALLSGLHPYRFPHHDSFSHLHYPRLMLFDLFGAAGYATGYISSQNEDWNGLRRFISSEVTRYEHSKDAPEDMREPHEQKALDAYTVDRYFDFLDETRRRQPGTRTFTYLNLQRTHWPYWLPEDAPRPFEPWKLSAPLKGWEYPRGQLDVVLNNYRNAMRYVDTQVGRLVDGLRERGLVGDVILCVVADHGEAFGEHDEVVHGFGLRDTTLQIPALLWGPGRISAELVIERDLHSVDVAPTLLAAAGLPPHPIHQGIDVVNAGPSAERSLYHALQNNVHLLALRQGRFKLVWDLQQNLRILHDLEADPAETEGADSEHPDRARAMFEQLAAWRACQVHYHEQPFPGRYIACP